MTHLHAKEQRRLAGSLRWDEPRLSGPGSAILNQRGQKPALIARWLLLALIVLCVSCAMNPQAVTHPGAVNQFDSNAYDTLVTAQGAIDAARPLAQTAAQGAILNKAIAAYNTAKNAYLIYHTQAAAGGKVDTATLTAQLTALVNSTANLAVQIQGAK